MYSIKILKEAEYKVIAFTNQPDISRGKVTLGEFEEELYHFGLDDLCICPHLPSESCKCRKPGTYMLEMMIKKYALDPSECYVIGDRWSDMLAGINAKMNVALVTTGYGNEALEKFADKWDVSKAFCIASDIFEAAKIIISHQ